MAWDSAAVSVVVVALTAILMRIPRVASIASRWSARVLECTERRPVTAALIVGVAWCAWLGGAMARDPRPAVPHSHDEQSYLLQARLFAEGHCRLPSPPAADFFDTFHVLVRPVYASRYPPGTALVHAPALWLGLPWIVTSFAIAGLTLAAVTYVGVRLAGPLATPVIVACAFTGGRFMTNALEAMSQPPLLLAVALFWVVAIAERDRHRLGWFAIAGLLAGFAVLVRPLDAILLLLPPGVAMLRDAWRVARSRGVALASLCALVALSPSVAFTAYFDHAITGDALRTPWSLYAGQSQPGERIGFATPAAGALPATAPPQKVDLYERYIKPGLIGHTVPLALRSWLVPGGRGVVALWAIAGPTLLLAIVPLALVGFRRRRLVALGASVALSLALYTAVAFGGTNYFYPIAPLVWIAGAAGLDGLLARRSGTWRTAAVVALALSLLASQLPLAANALARPSDAPFEEMSYIAGEVMPKVRPPAIVFFRYREGLSFHNEPVYNLDRADPTAGPIVRVHWLGARNVELLRALAATRRDSNVYLYDRAIGRLAIVGTLDDALRAFPTTAPAASTRP